MKLSAALLTEQLNYKGLSCISKLENNPGPSFKGVHFLPPYTSVISEHTSKTSDTEKDTAVLSADYLYADLNDLCSEYPESVLRQLTVVIPADSPCCPLVTNAIFVKNGAHMEEIFNELLCIFDRFAEWVEKTYKNLADNKSLNEILSCCSLVTRDTVWLGDSGFQFYGSSSPDLMFQISAIWRYQITYGYLPLDVADKLFRSEELQLLQRKHHAFSTDTKAFNLPYTCKNIYEGRVLRAHLFIISIYSKPSQTHSEIAEILGDILKPYVLSHPEFSRSAGKIHENFFRDLLNGNILEVSLVRSQINIWSWDVDDSYSIAVIDIADESQDRASYLIDYLSDTLEQCRACLMEDRISCVFHNSTPVSYNRFMDLLNRICLRMDLYAAVSISFNGLMSAPMHFKQVQSILHYGRQSDRSCHVFMQENFGIYSILNSCLEYHHAYEFCHPDILAIQEYDIKNNTEYLETLYQYLLYNCNAQQAAKHLYIHRNTMNYRLANIKEMLSIDIEVPLNRLYLLLSILLLKQSTLPS